MRYRKVGFSAGYTWNMESSGCVFLPVAGWRRGSSVEYIGSDGYYVSSTVSGLEFAYFLNFDNGLIGAMYDYRSDGCAIRLVSAAQ